MRQTRCRHCCRCCFVPGPVNTPAAVSGGPITVPRLGALSSLLQLLLCWHAAAAAPATPVPQLNLRLVCSLLAGSATLQCEEAGVHVDGLLSMVSSHTKCGPAALHGFTPRLTHQTSTALGATCSASRLLLHPPPTHARLAAFRAGAWVKGGALPQTLCDKQAATSMLYWVGCCADSSTKDAPRERSLVKLKQVD